ncbi:hypothetical protein CC78DRAFT_569730 [Lojkania enalia]|uniref:Uncharacterized protein n=1 Tax=Lojkania enalia TaxID=147567 RepID=A0A9P4MYI7_9PLEO|nr:hypothetical protein CC78DRAFT_569730 [Didymosphaeria enalia]
MAPFLIISLLFALCIGWHDVLPQMFLATISFATGSILEPVGAHILPACFSCLVTAMLRAIIISADLLYLIVLDSVLVVLDVLFHLGFAALQLAKPLLGFLSRLGPAALWHVICAFVAAFAVTGLGFSAASPAAAEAVTIRTPISTIPHDRPIDDTIEALGEEILGRELEQSNPPIWACT